ncbi:hypothetical protein [Streptomyces sp. B1-3]|uniref:hypothetical protein n=1 Tax=Streptomyces sp. B1-3 TaxID=3141453 RepID=UPI003D2B08E6
MTETAATKARKTTAAKAAPATETAASQPAPTENYLDALLTPQRFDTGSSQVPQQVAQMVENAFKAWEGGDKTWLVVELPSSELVERTFKQARRYVYERETRLTFQRRRTEDGTKLVFRVRDKIAAKGSRSK